MSITAAHINAVLKAADAGSGLVLPPDQIAELFNHAIDTFGDGQFDTTEKVSALLSESMMESAYFRTTEEYSKTGSYRPYIGRTFIQITHQSNYAKFSKWCFDRGLVGSSTYFVKYPKALADVKWAAIGPVWYFTQVLFHGKPLTAYANNISQVGKAVNIGDPFSKAKPNGWKARADAYKAVRSLGASLVTKPSAPPNVNTKENIMATGTKVRFWNNVDQSLKVGEQYVVINEGTSDVSVVSGENDGVQVVGVVEIDNPGGYEVHGFWRIADWIKDGDVFANENGLAIPAVGANGISDRQVIQASFSGSIPKPSKTGRSMRLRFVVRVTEKKSAAGKPAPELPKINNVHIDGWKL